MDNNKSIYVVLTGTGTLFSNTIQWFTKAPLNHASLAFDNGLREVYSFGRKKPSNPFVAGMIMEDFRNPFYRDTDCAVYRMPVQAHEFEAVHRHVRAMMGDCERYKYHLLGLLGVLLNKDLTRPDAFFCSQFVAYALETAGCKPMVKSAHFVTPADFGQALAHFEIYRGKLAEYTGTSAAPYGLQYA